MQSIELVVVEKAIAKNTNMESSSIHSESSSSQLDQTVTFQSKSHPHVSLFYTIHISNLFSQHKHDAAILIYHLPQG